MFYIAAISGDEAMLQLHGCSDSRQISAKAMCEGYMVYRTLAMNVYTVYMSRLYWQFHEWKVCSCTCICNNPACMSHECVLYVGTMFTV